MLWLWLVGCGLFSSEPEIRPADSSVWAPGLTGGFGAGELRLTDHQTAFAGEGYRAQPVRFDLRAGLSVSAALWLPETPGPLGVIVAHGHYGQGKSGAEAQEIAHRLARRGVTVLAVDTPGVEEWDIPGRRIHFEDGAHNRAYLAAGGSSALALQVDILRRGVDVLVAKGATRISATGASGGAVQAAYLQMSDARVDQGVFVSFPRIPREAQASGCPCDQMPGVPGPRPDVLAAIPGESLWLSEVPQERPSGLPTGAVFEVSEGPHSYTSAMQERALEWWEAGFDLPAGPWMDSTPAWDLTTGAADGDAMSIFDLPLTPTQRWEPQPKEGAAYTASCLGEGKRVLLLGADDADTAALQAAGFSPCNVEMLTPPGTRWDPLAQAEAIGTGSARADALAGAVQAASRTHGAELVWAVRGWGLVAGASGLPFVVREPVRTVNDVDEAVDAPWIHVPGAWWGATEKILAGALATGTDRVALIAAMTRPD